MGKKNLSLIAIIVLVQLSSFENTFAQKSPIDKGSTILSGNLAFSTLGGDLYSYDDKWILSLQFYPIVNYFVLPGLSVGGRFLLDGIKDGEYYSISVGGGPQILYFFGKKYSDSLAAQKLYPYFGFGYVYSASKLSGYGFRTIKSNNKVLYFLSGLCIMITESVGFTGEFVYQLDNAKIESSPAKRGDIFNTAFGFIIFL